MQNINQVNHPIDHQRLLNALESLSVSIAFVSTSVEMVRDALLTPPAESMCSCEQTSSEIAIDPTQQEFDFEAG